MITIYIDDGIVQRVESTTDLQYQVIDVTDGERVESTPQETRNPWDIMRAAYAVDTQGKEYTVSLWSPLDALTTLEDSNGERFRVETALLSEEYTLFDIDHKPL